VSAEPEQSTTATHEERTSGEGGPTDEGDGYLHEPDSTLRGDEAAADPGVFHPDATDREFDWRGWTLVCVMALAFVAAPLTIYLVPPSASVYLTVLVVVPLFPAVLLAAVAVWATTRP